jgi:hypothetical protein
MAAIPLTIGIDAASFSIPLGFSNNFSKYPPSQWNPGEIMIKSKEKSYI